MLNIPPKKNKHDRFVTTKSTSNSKKPKNDFFIDAICTDSGATSKLKSKSQCLSKEKIKPIDPDKFFLIAPIKNLGTSKIIADTARSKGGSSKYLTRKAKLGNERSNPSRERQRDSNQPIGNTDKNIKKKMQNFFYDNNLTDNQNITELKWMKKTAVSKKSSHSDQSSKSLEKKRVAWNQKHIPLTPKTTLQQYGYLLTKFERKEVLDYKQIYYIGHKAKKERSEYLEQNFDNKDKQYLFSAHDHIAYRYELLHLLGKGSYGQVVRVFDHKRKCQMALKIIKNQIRFSKQASIEMDILTYIKENDPIGQSNIVRIKDYFMFRGHVCMVFELLSDNLYELIIRNGYNGLNLQLIRRFSIQILTSLQFLRRHHIIHCDLKPENILLKEYSKSGIKLIDFGSSCFENQTIYTYIQSRYYRAPEITLGIKYDRCIDIWSTGCIIAELYVGVPLFPGENEREQMKYLVSTLGLPPPQVIEAGERVWVFFEKGELKKDILQMKAIDHFQSSLESRIQDPAFLKFIQKFLKWDPKDRITPLEALQDPWITEGIPDEMKEYIAVAKSLPEGQHQNKSNHYHPKPADQDENTEQLKEPDRARSSSKEKVKGQKKKAKKALEIKEQSLQAQQSQNNHTYLQQDSKELYDLRYRERELREVKEVRSSRNSKSRLRSQDKTKLKLSAKNSEERIKRKIGLHP